MCPTEEDWDVLMSFVFVTFTCVGRKGRKRGQWGWARGLKMGLLTLSTGQGRAEVHSYSSELYEVGVVMSS
jgi:hypothetical protein